jgi:hypothetical protein
MSTYEDTLLAARFAALAPRPLPGDWDDVLDRAGALRPRRRRLARPLWHGGRRRKLIVALAVAVLVAAVAAAAYGTVRVLILDKGFIGLPPEGATPSAPESGELEIFYSVTDPAGKLGRSQAWVYDDGRLIWLREKADIPERANPFSTGFLEQRLTPKGVELLRSEIASTGEFGDEAPRPPSLPPCPKGVSPFDNECEPPASPPAPNEPLTVPFYTTIEVAGLGRLVRVDGARDLERLEVRLSDPESWLPADAWADREIRAYVASKYAVCYGGWPPDEPMERSRVLALLPAAARDLLEKDAPLREGPLFGSPGHFRPSHRFCFDASTEEARALVAALDDAGVERKDTAVRLSYRAEAPGPNPGAAVVFFEPYLPHGDFICSVCG